LEKLSPIQFLRHHARTVALSVVLTAALVWVLNRGALPIFPPEGMLSKVDVWAASIAALCLFANQLLRQFRYYFLAAPLGVVNFARVFATLFVCQGIITLLPLRLGEFARPVLLRERGKLSAWTITGTVAAERIIDGVLMSALLLAGLTVAKPDATLPDHIGALPVPAAVVPQAAYAATLAFAGAFAVLVLFYKLRHLASAVTIAVLGVVSRPLGEKVASVMSHASDGLSFLPNLRYSGSYLCATMLSLYVNVVSIQFLAQSVGLPLLSFAQGSVVLGVLGLGFAMPSAPGFFGSVQLALYAGLAIYVPSELIVREGATLVFLYYVLHMIGVLTMSIVSLLFLARVAPTELSPET
jgi:glycosyltransferase 2 family protein